MKCTNLTHKKGCNCKDVKIETTGSESALSDGSCKPKDIKMKIVPMEVKPNTDAIEMLEKAIEDLKLGELTSVGISWVTKEGSIGGDVSGSNNGILMWASLEHNAKSFYADIILA